MTDGLFVLMGQVARPNRRRQFRLDRELQISLENEAEALKEAAHAGCCFCCCHFGKEPPTNWGPFERPLGSARQMLLRKGVEIRPYSGWNKLQMRWHWHTSQKHQIFDHFEHPSPKLATRPRMSTCSGTTCASLPGLGPLVKRSLFMHCLLKTPLQGRHLPTLRNVAPAWVIQPLPPFGGKNSNMNTAGGGTQKGVPGGRHSPAWCLTHILFLHLLHSEGMELDSCFVGGQGQ